MSISSMSLMGVVTASLGTQISGCSRRSMEAGCQRPLSSGGSGSISKSPGLLSQFVFPYRKVASKATPSKVQFRAKSGLVWIDRHFLYQVFPHSPRGPAFVAGQQVSYEHIVLLASNLSGHVLATFRSNPATVLGRNQGPRKLARSTTFLITVSCRIGLIETSPGNNLISMCPGCSYQNKGRGD